MLSNRRSLILAAAFVLFTSASALPDAQGKPTYSGRVAKQGTRVARPLAEDQPIQECCAQMQAAAAKNAPLAGAVSDQTFVLKSGVVNGSVSTEGWTPWHGAPLRAAATAMPAAASAPYVQAPVHIDYDAIERAYEEAVPRPPVSQIASGIPNVNPMLNPLTAAGLANPLTGVVANGTTSATVDYDNCLCGTAMPSDSCVRSRMAGFGVNVAATPQAAPTPMMTGVRVPGVRVPSVRSSAGMVRAGAGFALR